MNLSSSHTVAGAKGKRVSSFLCHVVVRLLQFGSPLPFVFPKRWKVFPSSLFCFWADDIGCLLLLMRLFLHLNERRYRPSIQPANQAPFHRRLEENSLLSYYIFSHAIFHHRPKKVSHSRFSYQLTLTVLWWFTSLSVVVSSKKTQKNTARSQVKSKIIGFFFCFLGDVWLFGGFVIYLFLISLFCWYIIHLKA